VHPKVVAFLEEADLDGFLFIGDSICDTDMFYLSHFLAGDRFTLLAQEKISLLVSSMELGRAKNESFADEVVSTSRYAIMDKLRACKKPDEAYLQVLTEFLRDRRVERLGVPYRFPVGIFQHLCGDFQISVTESPVSRWRAVKSANELDAIRASQAACERAMRLAVNTIAKSEIRGDQLYRDGRPLTSDEVRGQIEVSLLEDGCEAVDTIVAGGKAAADPHARGSGPLPANSPIVIDIFPRSKSSRYFADMTRTVLKGEASPEISELYEAVAAAQDAGLAAIRAGVTGKEVHARVCRTFQERGFPEREGRGFTHSTGHGVGLEVHEKPSLSEVGETLEAGHVVTVEPGLYYPEIGGVRLEDMVAVTDSGYENFTHFERKLVL